MSLVMTFFTFNDFLFVSKFQIFIQVEFITIFHVLYVEVVVKPQNWFSDHVFHELGTKS